MIHYISDENGYLLTLDLPYFWVQVENWVVTIIIGAKIGANSE